MTGYKNPPKHSQFKPGKSGNPRGRPKKDKDTGLIKLTGRLLNQPTVITKNGKREKASIVEALILKIIQDAFAGNTKAQEFLLKYYLQYVPPVNFDRFKFDAKEMTPEEASRRYREIMKLL
jgi:hypothetical protein